jgi:heat shock protein HslJ
MNQPSNQRARVFSGLGTALVVLAGALPMLSCSDEVTGPSDLGDGPWKLESMELAGAAPFVPDDPDRFTVEFRADGQLTVVADCNQCGGTYSVSDGALTVPPLACTLIACPGLEGSQFASLIDGTSSIESDGDELEIESSDGTLSLRR